MSSSSSSSSSSKSLKASTAPYEPPNYCYWNVSMCRYVYIPPKPRSRRGRPPKYHWDANGKPILHFPDGTAIPELQIKESYNLTKRGSKGSHDSDNSPTTPEHPPDLGTEERDLRYPTLSADDYSASSLDVVSHVKRRREKKEIPQRAAKVIIIEDDESCRSSSPSTVADEGLTSTPVCMGHTWNSEPQRSSTPPVWHKNIVQRGDDMPPITWGDLQPGRAHVPDDGSLTSSTVDFNRLFNVNAELPDNINWPNSIENLPAPNPIREGRSGMTMLGAMYHQVSAAAQYADYL